MTATVPGQFLPPSRENVELPSDNLHSLAEWYSYLYGRPFRSPYGLPQSESTAIEQRVKQYARLQLGDETFGSMMSHCYRSNAYIRAKFLLGKGSAEIDVYPGQVQYYIEHSLAGRVHRLAIVNWYQPVSSTKVRYRLGLDGKPRFCNAEMWRITFYPLSRESILPVHNILGRFVCVPKLLIGKTPLIITRLCHLIGDSTSRY
jgi:hypothetical protein